MVVLRVNAKWVDFLSVALEGFRQTENPMLAAIPFPDISPEIFSFSVGGFEFALRWYALSYIAGLLLGWGYIFYLMKRPKLWANGPPMPAGSVENLLTAMVIGVLLGGRFGYVFFYDFAGFMANPVQIVQVWKGGMSFHGGFIGVILATVWYSRANKVPLLSLGDAIAAAAPIGLLLGRLANFINAELWGRPTAVSWGVEFPGAGAQCPPDWFLVCARHPSQLYEAGLEGVLLGLILALAIFLGGALKKPGTVIGLFFLGYGLARIFVEAFRQPDAQFITALNPNGYVIEVAGFGLTMGQSLSLPMVLIGIGFLVYSGRRN